MSHVVDSDLEFRDLELMMDVMKAEGWTVKKQETFRWFGRHVGDYKLPEGFTKEEMGKCDYAVSVLGCEYDIGIVKSKVNTGAHKLMFDFWGPGKQLETLVGGKSCESLFKKYNEKLVYKVAHKTGSTVTKSVLPSGEIKLVMRKAY